MNIIIRKIDADRELDQTDYTSLTAWEAAQDYGDESFAIGVVHFTSDWEYEYLLQALHIDLEELPFNFLLIHSGGKILAYKYDKEFMQCSYGKNFFEKASLEKAGYLESIKKFLAEKFSIHQSRVFLCHASEDKDDVVLPLASALNSANIDYWVDSVTIKLGDSITEKVNEGLRTSEYFILVLSISFVGKPWPEKELNSILSMNIASGKQIKQIIPILVGTAEERRKIRDSYPLLHDVHYFSWEDNPDEFIKLFKERMNRDLNER